MTIHYKFRSSKGWLSAPIDAKIRRDEFASLVAAKHGLKRVYVATSGDVFHPDSWVDVSTVPVPVPAPAVSAVSAPATPATPAYDIDDEFGPDVYSAVPPPVYPPAFTGIYEVVGALGELGIAAEQCQLRILEIAKHISVDGIDDGMVRDLYAWKERVKRDLYPIECRDDDWDAICWAAGVRMALLRLERALFPYY